MRLYLYLLLLFYSLFFVSRCSILSSSVLEECVEEHDNNDYECSGLLKLTLAIDSRTSSKSERLLITQTVHNGEKVDIEEVTISFSKGETYIRHGLSFVDYFPFGIEEFSEPLRSDNKSYLCRPEKGRRMFFFDCLFSSKDKASESSKLIQSGEILDGVLATGKRVCYFLKKPIFHGYRILEGTVFFNVTVHAEWESRTGSDKKHSISLFLNKREVKAPDNSFSVRHIGELGATVISGSSVVGKYFFIPSGTSCNSVNPNCLIIPSEAITLNGLECDKIGVSPSYLVEEARRCERKLGSCINWQIRSLFGSDEARYKQNEPELYVYRPPKEIELLTSLSVESNLNDDDTSIAKEDLWFSSQIPYSSILELQLNGIHVKRIIKRASGILVSATIMQEKSLAYTEGNSLKVVVKNTGLAEAMFTVQALKCSSQIWPPVEQRVVIPPAEEISVIMPLRYHGEEGDVRCTIHLLDSTLSELMTLDVNWLIQKPVPTLKKDREIAGTSAIVEIIPPIIATDTDSKSKCFFLNLQCLWNKGYISNFFKEHIFIILLAFFVFLFICIVFRKIFFGKIILTFISLLTCCCCKKSNKRSAPAATCYPSRQTMCDNHHEPM